MNYENYSRNTGILINELYTTMTLVDLVRYFKSGVSYEEFCLSQSLDLESEAIEVYMKGPFDINNELAFFEIEKSNGKIEYFFEGANYFNLFDFYHFLDTIEESRNTKNRHLTDDEIARILLAYADNDA